MNYVSLPTLRAKRHEAKEALSEAGSRMKGAAEKGGPAYDGAVSEFERIEAEFLEADAAVKAAEAHERSAAASAVPRSGNPAGTFATGPIGESASGLVFRTSEGKLVKALSPAEKLTDATDRAGGDSAVRELGIGGLVKAYAFGPGNDIERKALAESSAIAGGFLVPSELSAMVIDQARNQARTMQAGVLTIPMDKGNLTLAKVTGDPTPGWRGENEAIAESGMTFGSITLNAHSVGALVKLSRELVEDAPNAAAIVEAALFQQLALSIDAAILFGPGTNHEPLGLKRRLGAGRVNEISMGDNGAAFSDYDKWLDAVQAIEDANGPSEGLAAIMAPRTKMSLEKLKDSQNQPLLAPETFRNLRRLTTNQVPTNLTVGTGENCSDAFVGDFGQVLMGVAGGIQIEVSRDASDANGGAFANHQVWVKATARLDVAVMRENWLSVITGIKAA